MKRSVFGEMLDELLATTLEPLSTTMMADAVGCSLQRAYAWVAQAHSKGDLIAMGTDPTGGTLYLSRRNPLAQTSRRTRRGRGSDDTGVGLEVGTELRVTRIMLVGGGEVKLELTTQDGRSIEALVVAA